MWSHILMFKTKITVYMLSLIFLIDISKQNEINSYSRDLFGSTDSVKTCLKNEDNPGHKWCKNVNDYSLGFSCNKKDSSANWGKDFGSIWSDDSEKLAKNAMKLLWPLSYSSWNTQSYTYNLNLKFNLILFLLIYLKLFKYIY